MTITATKNRVGRPVDPKSAMTKAREIFATLPETSRTRKEVIKVFIANGMSSGTSAAYYSVITKKKKD